MPFVAILIRSEADHERMNPVDATGFAAGRFPARTRVGVTGPAKRARVEIDFIARRPTATAA